jgi:hypothetical protein
MIITSVWMIEQQGCLSWLVQYSFCSVFNWTSHTTSSVVIMMDHVKH